MGMVAWRSAHAAAPRDPEVAAVLAAIRGTPEHAAFRDDLRAPEPARYVSNGELRSVWFTLGGDAAVDRDPLVPHRSLVFAARGTIVFDVVLVTPDLRSQSIEVRSLRGPMRTRLDLGPVIRATRRRPAARTRVAARPRDLDR